MKPGPVLKKAAAGVLVIAGGLLAGFAARTARGGEVTAASVRNTWAANTIQHSDAAYDRATVRFAGRLGPGVMEAVRPLGWQSTVLVVLRGDDVRACEDLGRQLRELRRAVPDADGRGMAVLVDPAGEADLRLFLARERLPRVRVVTADPAGLLADGTAVATPAALVADGDGRVRAGVSHSTRFKNVRSRSFAQELPLAEPGSR